MLATVLLKRIQATNTYVKGFDRICSKVYLLKAKISVSTEKDYKLSKLCHRAVVVKVFEGDHLTILDNPRVAEEINQIIRFKE